MVFEKSRWNGNVTSNKHQQLILFLQSLFVRFKIKCLILTVKNKSFEDNDNNCLMISWGEKKKVKRNKWIALLAIFSKRLGIR